MALVAPLKRLGLMFVEPVLRPELHVTFQGLVAVKRCLTMGFVALRLAHLLMLVLLSTYQGRCVTHRAITIMAAAAEVVFGLPLKRASLPVCVHYRDTRNLVLVRSLILIHEEDQK